MCCLNSAAVPSSMLNLGVSYISCVDSELAIGECKEQNLSCKQSLAPPADNIWFGIPCRPPYVIPRRVSRRKQKNEELPKVSLLSFFRGA